MSERCKDCWVKFFLPGPNSPVNTCTGSSQPELAMKPMPVSKSSKCDFCGREKSDHAVAENGRAVCHWISRFEHGKILSGGDTRIPDGAGGWACTHCEMPYDYHRGALWGINAPFCQTATLFNPGQDGLCTVCFERESMHFTSRDGLACLGGGFFYTSQFQAGAGGLCQFCASPEKEHLHTRYSSYVCTGFNAGSDGNCTECHQLLGNHNLPPPKDKVCILTGKRQYVKPESSGDEQSGLQNRCDGCRIAPIQGPIWQCNDCNDKHFDLCGQCYTEFQKTGRFHKAQEHSFSELVSPCVVCRRPKAAHHMGQFCKLVRPILRPAPIMLKRRCCNCWKWVKKHKKPPVWDVFACSRCKAREEMKHYIGQSKPTAKCDQCGMAKSDHVFSYCQPVSSAALEKFSLTSALAKVSLSPAVPESPAPADPMVLLLIGTTGVGKSAMCNTLLGLTDTCNPKYFVESPASSSCTMEVSKQTGPFFGASGNALLTVVDSPGFNDSGGAEMDEQHLAALRTCLSTTPVHAVAVVLNAEAPRMDGKLQRVLAVVAEALANCGDHDLRKLVVMVNRYSLSEESIKRRAEQLRRSNLSSMFDFDLDDPQVQKQYQVEQLTRTLEGLVPEHCVETIATEQTFFLDAHFESMCKKGTSAYHNSFHSFLHFVAWFAKTEEPVRVQIPEEATFQQITEQHQRKMDELERKKKEVELELAAEQTKFYEALNEKEQQHMQEKLELQTKLSESEKAELARQLKEANAAVPNKMLAMLCKHVYRKAAEFQANVAKADPSLVVVKQSDEPRYAIVVHKVARVVIVVFRGTEITSLVDLVTDMDFNVSGHNIKLPPDQKSEGTVSEDHQLDLHNGIAGRLKARVQGGEICHENILHYVKKAVAEFQVLRLIYTGHSLGGGLAIACRAFHLEGAIDVMQTDTVTFGAPLVVSSETSSRVKQLLARRTHNFAYMCDPVPRLLRFKTGGVKPQYLMAYLEKVVIQPALVYASKEVDKKTEQGQAAGAMMGMLGMGAAYVGSVVTGGGLLLAGTGLYAVSHILGGTVKKQGRDLFQNSDQAKKTREKFENVTRQILDAGEKYEPCGEDCRILVSQVELSQLPTDSMACCLRAHSIEMYVEQVSKLEG